MLQGIRISPCVRTVLLPLAIYASCSLAHAQQVPPYRDTQLPVEQRVSDLLSRMTLEEKLAQMEGAWENRQFFNQQQSFFVDQKGAFLPENERLLLIEKLAIFPGTLH